MDHEALIVLLFGFKMVIGVFLAASAMLIFYFGANVVKRKLPGAVLAIFLIAAWFVIFYHYVIWWSVW